MHRSIPIALALILALAAVQPAAAGRSKARQIERMTARFEQLLRPLVGAIEARELVFHDQGNGVMSLSYPIDRAKRAGLGRKASGNGQFRTLACGHMLGEPTNPATLVNSVISDLESPYNLWWTVLNTTDVEETRETTVKLIGPGEFDIEVSQEVIYLANAVNLIWFNPEIPFSETGLYVHRVSVKGGAKAAYRFWAEAATTTTSGR